MSYTGSSFPADLLAGEPSVERLALRKRGSFSRVLTTFCIGVAATLTWQSYGDAARQIIASPIRSFPGWLRRLLLRRPVLPRSGRPSPLPISSKRCRLTSPR